MADTEDSLIRRACDGDENALEELLRRHRPALHDAVERSLSRPTRGFLTAEDIVQEAFVDAYLRIGTFEPRGNGAFAAWLRTIARRRTIDAIRAHRTRKRGGGGATPGASVDSVGAPITLDSVLHLLVAASTARPSRSLARRELADFVERLAERLPPDYARLLRSDLAGRSADEIAAELGKSRGAIYTMRNRLHDELRRLFQGRTSEIQAFL